MTFGFDVTFEFTVAAFLFLAGDGVGMFGSRSLRIVLGV